MRSTRSVRLTVLALTCLLLWAGVLWLLPAMRLVRANPGSLFVTVAGSGTACSRARPCGLQTALAQSVNGDRLYVAAGTYTGAGAAVVTVTKSITLYGGWNGAATGPVVRDPVANRSILDGQGARRVVYANGAIAFTVDGFTIQRGNAMGAPDPGRGGGIYSQGAWPVIANNIITGNTAYMATSSTWGWGGGVYVDLPTGPVLIQGNQVLGNISGSSSPGMGGGLCLRLASEAQVLDNLVLNNTASITNGVGYGGGIAVIRSDDSTVLGNTIESNQGAAGPPTQSGRGGGLYIEQSSGVVLKNNRIRNNMAGVAGAGYGGGVAAYWASGLLAANNLVEGNTASAGPGQDGLGGGMNVLVSLNVTINSNRVLGNTANTTRGQGGGLWIESNTSFTMTNNIVAGNRASIRGGGLALGANATEPVTGTLLHNTFVANNSGSGDGRVAIYLCSSWISVTLVNNLLSTHAYGLCAVGGTATLRRTLFYGNSSGDTCGGTIVSTGALTGHDPLLDATYHLRAGSPAIDAGVNAGVTADIDGDARPLDAGYDIGADEYTEPQRVYLPLVLRSR